LIKARKIPDCFIRFNHYKTIRCDSLNRDRPKGYQREIRRVQQEIRNLKWKYVLTKIYIRIVRVSLPYLAAIITRLPYTPKRSRLLDWLVALAEEEVSN
jgi:hypothetical protein